jgi:hypothetical protein
MILDFLGYVTRVNLEGQEGRQRFVKTSDRSVTTAYVPPQVFIRGSPGQRAGTVQETTSQ